MRFVNNLMYYACLGLAVAAAFDKNYDVATMFLSCCILTRLNSSKNV